MREVKSGRYTIRFKQRWEYCIDPVVSWYNDWKIKREENHVLASEAKILEILKDVENPDVKAGLGRLFMPWTDYYRASEIIAKYNTREQTSDPAVHKILTFFMLKHDILRKRDMKWEGNERNTKKHEE